jgi:hypothetical protein
MEINQEIIDKTVDMIREHLENYGAEIGTAFSENDEILEIKLKARYSFNKGKFKIQTGINFVTERIKDDTVLWYDPEQREFNFNLNGTRDPADSDPNDD